MVYTDHQRLELEKEFHYNRYITIRRKAELAANLALSERQVSVPQSSNYIFSTGNGTGVNDGHWIFKLLKFCVLNNRFDAEGQNILSNTVYN